MLARISRKSANEGGNIVSPMQRLPLPPEDIPGHPFLLEAESTPGPK